MPYSPDSCKLTCKDPPKCQHLRDLKPETRNQKLETRNQRPGLGIFLFEMRRRMFGDAAVRDDQIISVIDRARRFEVFGFTGSKRGSRFELLRRAKCLQRSRLD